MGAEAAAGLIGSAMGMISQASTNARNERVGKEMMGMQLANQKELNAYNNELALDMWHKTNYSAQIDEMKKAGVNPALLYGMKGGGGVTTNTQGGSAAAGSIPNMPNPLGMLGSAMQTAVQTQLMEAQTRKTNAEADKIAGVDTANTQADTDVKVQSLQNLAQNVESEKAKQKLTEIQTELEKVKTEVAGQTIGAAINTIEWGAEDAMGKAMSAKARGIVDANTTTEAVNIIRAEATGALLDNLTKQAGLGEIATKIEKLKAEIRQGDTKNAIEKFKAELQSEYPAVWDTAGKMLNDVIMTIQSISGNRDTKPYRKVDE